MKQALVIGASSGIGRGLAGRLAAAGWRVGVVGRREALLRELAATAPANMLYAVADVTQPAACIAALTALVERIKYFTLASACTTLGDSPPELMIA